MLPLQSKHLEHLRERIQEPEVWDPHTRIDRELPGTIVTTGGRRKHFAHPVGRQGEKGVGRQVRQSLATPACEIGDQHVRIQVELGFVEDPPTARAAAIAKLEGREQCGAERGRSNGVRGGRSRTDHQIAAYDLTDNVFRKRRKVLVGCRSTGCQRHARIVAQGLRTRSLGTGGKDDNE